MELFAWLGIGIVLVPAVWYLVRRRRMRPRTLAGRWAVRNGYVYRRDPRVHLFVQGPPFDRGDGVIERALLVGSCAGRPSLITHFGWYHGNPGQVAGSSVALVLELPGEVASPLQADHLPDAPAGAGFDEAYRVTCDSDALVGDVLNPRARRAMLAVPPADRVGLRLDGTAMIVWIDAALTTARQLETVHDLATELYRLIPRTVYADRRPAPALPGHTPPIPGGGVRVIDIHGRPGEVWQSSGPDGDEVSVSLPVGAAWPRLSIVAYEWMADQYRATTFDKPDPSAYPLVDIMFAVRSADDNFRRKVLADLADWLPLDERTRRCGLLLNGDKPAGNGSPNGNGHGYRNGNGYRGSFNGNGATHNGRITAYAPGRLTDTALVAMLTDVVYEVCQRLSERTYRHRPATLSADRRQQV